MGGAEQRALGANSKRVKSGGIYGEIMQQYLIFSIRQSA